MSETKKEVIDKVIADLGANYKDDKEVLQEILDTNLSALILMV